MPNHVRDLLLRQFDTSWKLLSYHLEDLSTDECLWRPAARGLHVHRVADGTWRADWPTSEAYDTGPPSIAWITWHAIFWWSMVLDYSFGRRELKREDVHWPGTAQGVRESLSGLHARWRAEIAPLTDGDLRSVERTRWPFEGRPFADVVGWVSVELTKNAAEIGYARFLRRARTD